MKKCRYCEGKSKKDICVNCARIKENLNKFLKSELGKKFVGERLSKSIIGEVSQLPVFQSISCLNCGKNTQVSQYFGGPFICASCGAVMVRTIL